MAEIIVSARQVFKNYGNFTALNSVDLVVKRGEILGLVGDNGAGKSTLFKLLTGLIFETSGEVTVFGSHSQKDLGLQLRRVGSMIESPGYFPYMSVEKNLEYYRVLKGVPGKDSVGEILSLINLTHARKMKAKTLSMGMKQRLGLGIALLGNPELLILDEPINGLDPSGIVEMRTLLLRLNREKNITILISSHILPELEQLATVFAFMDKGSVLEQVSTKQLHERCQDYIEIAVSDPKQYVALLERELGLEDYLVLPDQTIRILNPRYDIERFSGLASTFSMEIYKLERHKASLTQYFLELKERSAS